MKTIASCLSTSCSFIRTDDDGDVEDDGGKDSNGPTSQDTVMLGGAFSIVTHALWSCFCPTKARFL